jgi:hypothetical protein
VATRGEPFEIPVGSGPTRTVSSILDPTATDEGLNREKYELREKATTGSIGKPRLLCDVIDRATQKGGRQGERVYDIGHVGITVCASSGGPGAKTGLYKVGDVIRRLNVKETLGMFGFPNTYSFGDVKPEHALFYLGNSIVVDVVKAFVEPIVGWFSREASSRSPGETSA